MRLALILPSYPVREGLIRGSLVGYEASVSTLICSFYCRSRPLGECTVPKVCRISCPAIPPLIMYSLFTGDHLSQAEIDGAMEKGLLELDNIGSLRKTEGTSPVVYGYHGDVYQWFIPPGPDWPAVASVCQHSLEDQSSVLHPLNVVTAMTLEPLLLSYIGRLLQLQQNVINWGSPVIQLTRHNFHVTTYNLSRLWIM